MILTIVMAAVVLPLSNLVSVLFTQNVVDAIAGGKSLGTVFRIILFYSIILLILSLINNVFDSFYSEKKESEIQLLINRDICNYASKVDYNCFDNPDFYDTYTWTLKQFSAQSAGARRILINFCIAISTIVSMTSFISVLSPSIIILVVLQILILAFIEIKQNKTNIIKQEELNSINRHIDYNNTVFYGKQYAADIRCTYLTKYMFSNYEEMQKCKISTIKKFEKKLFAYTGLQNVFGRAYTVLLMMIICYQFTISKSIVGVGKFSSLLNAAGQLSSSLYKMVGVFKSINASSLYVDKFRDFQKMSEKSMVASSVPLKKISDMPYSIEFRNVFFKYPSTNFELNNISLRINKGEKVAIVGENGMGKSTLIKLLLRLYDCNSGDIFVNGINIKDISVDKYRQSIGVAFQAPHIYALSLRQNVSLYLSDPIENMESILKRVQLSDIIHKSDANEDTELTRQFDKNGIELSGGEIQKISLARVFSKQFGMIVLDEASSALDPNAEYEMNKIIFDSPNSTTTLLVAHRLSSIKDADHIYVMHNGIITEHGNHDELMSYKGLYYEMFNKQAEKYK